MSVLGRAALVGAAAVGAAAVWWRRNPSACPYGQRFWVEAPHPFITRARLRDLYSAHRRGAYVGREAEWAAIDADIIAASREGRVFE